MSGPLDLRNLGTNRPFPHTADKPSQPEPISSSIPFPSSELNDKLDSPPLGSSYFLPHARRTTRSIRLSGVSPSVRLTVANAENSDLVQSAQPHHHHHQRQSRSSFSSHPIPIVHSALPNFARAGSIHNSPTASESFSHSLSKLGLSRSRRVADDVASVYSDSTVARLQNPSAEAAMRRLRGEVSGVGLGEGEGLSDC